MNAPLPADGSTPTSAPNLTDGLALWDSESADTAPAALTVIRLDANEKLLIPFTTSLVRCQLHYLDYPSLRGYVHCVATDCLLCRIGRQPEARDLWPVYDALERVVGVLPISSNQRPQALRPQLAPVLRRLQQGAERLVLAVRRSDTFKHHVRAFPLPPDADDGAAILQAFVAQLQAGVVDLAGVFPRMTADELAAVPEIASAMQLRGIQKP